jgi:F420-dependent oxidoreductase-like protein
MRFGQLLDPQPSTSGNYFDAMLAIARASEAVGLDAVWLADHVQFQKRGALAGGLRKIDLTLRRFASEHPLKAAFAEGERRLARLANRRPENRTAVLECFTTLGAIAAATTRVRLGAFVAGAPYRNPALLAKINTTLDVVSHGRCIVGLGAAWHEEEFAAYGWPFPSVRQRMEMLEDTIRIVKAMMTDMQGASYTGKHHRIANALNYPPPIQKPHPPIMIGGSGERRTLRLVAQYADYCNVFGDAATVAHKFAVLREHCAAVGRPYDSITRSNFVGILIASSEADLAAKRKRYTPTLGYPIVGTPERVIDELKAFVAAGVQFVVFHLPDAHNLESIYLFAEKVMPAFATASV